MNRRTGRITAVLSPHLFLAPPDKVGHTRDAALVPRPGNVRGGWYRGGMGCYDLSTGEVCKGLDRLPGSPARDRIELAAALVGAVAGVRAEAGGLEFPDRTSEAWQQLEKRLEALTRVSATLGSRIPRIRDPRLALTIAHGLDTLLCNITTGYNALELAIGDGLAALETGRRAMDLKYSNVGDYAREELGMNASTAYQPSRSRPAGAARAPPTGHPPPTH